MNSPPPHFDAYSAGLLLFGVAVGPELAPIVSAYGLIVLGWIAGMLIAIYIRRQGLPVWVYAILSGIISIGMSGYLAHHLGGTDAAGWLLTIAAALAAFVDKTVGLLSKLWERIAETFGVAK